jgi:HAD superfamily hydrolase (TIGR01662 family)
MTVSIVIPTVGRATLATLLDSLAHRDGPVPAEVIVVDDRPGGPPLDVEFPGWLDGRTRILRSGGHGPAVARNAGWHAARSDWVAFLDDDVVVGNGWLRDLADDLDGAGRDVAGVQGRITVPLPAQRRPNDWERNTAGLASAHWITADMAYRRSALVEVGGFDGRFPRAFREDADLALRMLDRGCRLVLGNRRAIHPVRAAGWWASARQQAGNADDALMSRVHGDTWRERAGAPRGRFAEHALTSCVAISAGVLMLAGRRRAALAAAAAWAVATARFAWVRIAPGPRDAPEIARMVSTSVVIPPLAVGHRLAGRIRHRHAGRRRSPFAAVLFDRDGTIVHDVPYNGDPSQVQPVRGAREALDRLRAAGVAVGVITNQSGIARGLVTADEVESVNARIEELLGPFAVWQVCPHAPDDGCPCRKPNPGLVVRAAAALRVPPRRCVVVGDIGADVEAARAAGALGVLVPNPTTLADEIRAAPVVCASLGDAVEAVLAGGAR